MPAPIHAILHDTTITMKKTKRSERHLMVYLSAQDVDVVRDRMPAETKTRLRDVFLVGRSRGVRSLGAVTIRGRRDVELCACLPPRVSLRRFIYQGQSPTEFGAPRRGQWPPWAVRRFLLYDVFLHELGHLQLVNAKSKNWRRKYAGETWAEEFADGWRRRLFAKPFPHCDPVHNAPTEEERAGLELWERLDKAQRYQLALLTTKAPHEVGLDLSFLGGMSNEQELFLRRLLYQ